MAVYRDTAAHWDLYELAEKLVDLEDAFRQWRFRHATTVERIIGFKRGTGGTSGVGLSPEGARCGTLSGTLARAHRPLRRAALPCPISRTKRN